MKKRYIPLLFLAFVNTLNFAILIPVLPFVVEKFGGGASMYGIILAAYPLFQFFAAPLLGSLSDRFGRRPILLLSQLGTLLSWVVFVSSYFFQSTLLFGVALPIIIIFIARMVDGATGGNISVSDAYLADITTPQERTRAYGIIGAMTGVGLIIGPVLGGFGSSSSIGYVGAGLIAIVVSAITLLIMHLHLPESLDEEHRMNHLEFHLLSEINFLKKLRQYEHKWIHLIFTVRSLFLLAFFSFTSIFIYFVVDEFGLTQTQVALVFTVLGVFLGFNQAVLSPKIADRFGNVRGFFGGVALMAITQSCMIFVPNIWLFMILLYLNNIGISLAMPTFKTLITSQVEKHQQGEINGIDQSISSAVSAMAPLLSGYLYEHMGSYVFLVLSFILLGSIWLYKARRQDVF